MFPVSHVLLKSMNVLILKYRIYTSLYPPLLPLPRLRLLFPLPRLRLPSISIFLTTFLRPPSVLPSIASRVFPCVLPSLRLSSPCLSLRPPSSCPPLRLSVLRLPLRPPCFYPPMGEHEKREGSHPPMVFYPYIRYCIFPVEIQYFFPELYLLV